MNTAHDSIIEVNPDPPAPTPRDIITKHIAHAQMPAATKKLAAKLLAHNQQPGTRFLVKMAELRGICHAATNIDVLKHLRRMRAIGLLEYTIFFGTQTAEMRFVTTRANDHAKQQD